MNRAAKEMIRRMGLVRFILPSGAGGGMHVQFRQGGVGFCKML
jgi:hypothetical protein